MVWGKIKRPFQVIWVIWTCGMLRISDAVSVQHHRKLVVAKAKDTSVVLPCNFSTSSYETPQITWYQEDREARRLIMKVDVNNQLSSYGDFKNRVARGDRGALVLLRPVPRDSGNYSCEIEADKEVPSRVTTILTLEITEDPLNPLKADTDLEYGKKGLIFLVAFFWILPMICFLVLDHTAFSSLCKQTSDNLRKKTTKQLFALVSKPVVVVIASCLAFAGTVCTAVALSSTSADVINYYRGVGFATGIPGTLILLIAVVWLCLSSNTTCGMKCSSHEPASRNAESTEHKAEQCSLSEVFNDAETDSRNAPVQVARNDGSTSSEEAIFLIPQADITGEMREPEVTVIKNPVGGSVTDMAAVSYSEIYVTTVKAVFKMNITEISEQNIYTQLCDGKDDYLNVVKYEDNLLLSAMKSTTKPGDSPKSNSPIRIQRLTLNSPKIHKIRLDTKSTVTWIMTSRDEESLYLTTSNPASVVKGTVDKQRIVQNKTFGEHVLKNPTCIAQNSSGQIIVADPANHDLFVFAENGDFVTSLKTFVPKNLKHEMKGRDKLAVGLDDKVYASSPLSENILVFSSDFRLGRLLPTRPGSGEISSLLVHYQSLYVAHKNSICIYPLGYRLGTV